MEATLNRDKTINGDSSPGETNYICVFLLDNQSFGLWLDSVVRVERMVKITPLPKAPGIVLGIINARGVVIPVIDIRKRFNLPPRGLCLYDQLIITRTPLSGRLLAIPVDLASGLVEGNQDAITPAEAVFTGIQYTSGVLKRLGDMIIINDLDTFLSDQEEAVLNQALTVVD